MPNQLLDPSSPLLTGGSLSWAHAVDILIRLLCAFSLGSLLAHRPWRWVVGHHAARVQTDTAQTQAIIAVAGALLVIVIGESLARAFGLVGLGTFIRFRAGVKDPRDVAVLFVMIGVGMACGLGLVATAALGTAFVAAVLIVFDRFAPPRRRRLTISIRAADPVAVRAAVRAAFPEARAVDVAFDETGARSAYAIAVTDAQDAFTILETLRERGAAGILSLRVEED